MPIDSNRLRTYPFFNYFYDTNDPNLTYHGLRETNRNGVELLYQWAKNHNVDGTEAAPDRRGIGADERRLAQLIAEHQNYRGTFAQGILPVFLERFGIKPESEEFAPPDPPSVRVTRAEAPIHLPEVKPVEGLESADANTLPRLLKAALARDKGPLARMSARDRGLHQLAVFKQFTDKLWRDGEQTDTLRIADELLDMIESHPEARAVGREDHNGAGWGVAQSLALGLDPNELVRSFPRALPSDRQTIFFFDRMMVGPMSYVDAYRRAMGMEESAVDFQQKSFLSWVVGDRPKFAGEVLPFATCGGWKPAQVVDERRPFETTGLKWGTLLFPGDPEVAALPVKEGFEFPIDCLRDGGELFATALPENGDHLQVFDLDARRLDVEKVIHHDESGKAVAWSARFKDAGGREVPPDQVMGRIWAAGPGVLQGDGRADMTKDVGWQGFCERIAAQAVYKAHYGIPELDREVVPIKAGEAIIGIPRAEAQKLFDAEIHDLAPDTTYCGFRFNDEVQAIVLDGGEVVTGRIMGLEHLQNTRQSRSLGGDVIKVPNTGRQVFRGAVEIATDDGARVVDGSQIKEVVGRTEDDVRISRYIGWIAEQKGVFVTDAMIGAPLSNGPRWVNQVEIEAREDEQRPVWAMRTGELRGLHGPLVRSPRDRMLWIRGLYGPRDDAAARESGDPGRMLIQFSGWVQVNRNGRIVNEGFISGQPDFAWNAKGPIDWSRPSAFNPYVPPEFRLQLLVNGVKDRAKLEALAERLNLPPGWAALRVEEA